MSKEVHVIYYGRNGDAAKHMATAARADKKTPQIRHAEAFDGVAEECTAVVIMADVSGHDRSRIVASYGEKVSEPKVTAVVPPPPPPVIPPPPAPPSQE